MASKEPTKFQYSEVKRTVVAAKAALPAVTQNGPTEVAM